MTAEYRQCAICHVRRAYKKKADYRFNLTFGYMLDRVPVYIISECATCERARRRKLAEMAIAK